jgi:hypothetical protein
MPVVFQRTITLPDPDVFHFERLEWRMALCAYPGVYAMYVGEECVYVGKSINSVGSRIWAHLFQTPSWGLEDPQKEMRDRLRFAASEGKLTIHAFRCAAPDQVEGDVIACLGPTMQGKGRWHRVNHGGASEATCVRVQ